MQFLIGMLLILFNNSNGFYFKNTINHANTNTEKLAADSVEMVFVEGGTFSMGCEGGLNVRGITCRFMM